MPALSSATLLGLALLATPADAHASPPSCAVGMQQIELTADALGASLPVCIHPGLATSFLFDSRLARVELEGRQRFRVQEGEDGFTLVPTEALADGERVPVTVYFQDGAAPARVTFMLVVHPSDAARQVEVTRHPRTRASYQQGEAQARAEARQCQEDKARLQAACSVQQGLTGLIAKAASRREIPTTEEKRNICDPYHSRCLEIIGKSPGQVLGESQCQTCYRYCEQYDFWPRTMNGKRCPGA